MDRARKPKLRFQCIRDIVRALSIRIRWDKVAYRTKPKGKLLRQCVMDHEGKRCRIEFRKGFMPMTWNKHVYFFTYGDFGEWVERAHSVWYTDASASESFCMAIESPRFYMGFWRDWE